MRRPFRPTPLVLVALAALATTVATCGGGETTCSSKFSAQPRLSEIQSAIFNRSCAFQGCHGDKDTEPKDGPMALVSGQSYLSLLNTATEKPAAKRVLPLKPDQSYIIEKLTVEMPTDGERMPKGAEPLCNEEIKVIQKWIALGAKND